MPLLEVAGGIAGKLAGPAARPLLRYLLDVQDQQLQALTTIEKGVRRLLEKPWRHARLLLAEAAEMPDDDPLRTVNMEDARKALFEAYSINDDVHPARAPIAAEISMLYGLLGRTSDCHRWAATAHEDAIAVVTTNLPLVQKAMNRREWLPGAEIIRSAMTLVQYAKRADPIIRQREFWTEQIQRLIHDNNIEVIEAIERFYEKGEVTHPPRRWPDDLDYYPVLLGLNQNNTSVSTVEINSILMSILYTTPSIQLMNLGKEAQQPEEYRQVRLTLQPHLRLPHYTFKVNLRKAYHAQLTWDADATS